MKLLKVTDTAINLASTINRPVLLHQYVYPFRQLLKTADNNSLFKLTKQNTFFFKMGKNFDKCEDKRC